MATYIAHHGIKGQKWYNRRYQNSDGSLTPLGRVHYGVGKARDVAGGAVKKVKSAKQTVDKTIQDAKQRKYDRAKKKLADAESKREYLDTKKQIKALKHPANSKARINNAKKALEKEAESKKKSKKNPLDNLSNEEVQSLIDRMRLETEYAKASSELKKMTTKPDSWIVGLGKKELERAANNAVDSFTKFDVNKFINKKLGIDTESAKEKAEKESALYRNLSQVENSKNAAAKAMLARGESTKKIAEKLNLSESQVDSLRPQPQSNSQSKSTTVESKSEQPSSKESNKSSASSEKAPSKEETSSSKKEEAAPKKEAQASKKEASVKSYEDYAAMRKQAEHFIDQASHAEVLSSQRFNDRVKAGERYVSNMRNWEATPTGSSWVKSGELANPITARRTISQLSGAGYVPSSQIHTATLDQLQGRKRK